MKIAKTIEMACGQAYVLQLDKDNQLIEVGDVYLPNENKLGTRPYKYQDFWEISDKNKRVMTICTMVGCCFNCQFCSAKRTFKRHLSKEELLGQVDFLIQQGKKYGRSTDPMESQEFHVLYTRMGEPCANIDNVIASIQELIKRYPHVKIGMSTNGYKDGVYQFFDYPEIIPHIMMQFSVHATDDATRSKVLGMENNYAGFMDLAETSTYIKEFRKINPRMVSLNFILLEGIKYDFWALKKIFDPKDIYIRLSPLNITENSDRVGMNGLIKESDVIDKKPVSSQELIDIIADIERSWFTYAYAPAIDEEIKYNAACGQALETLKKEKRENSFYQKS